MRSAAVFGFCFTQATLFLLNCFCSRKYSLSSQLYYLIHLVLLVLWSPTPSLFLYHRLSIKPGEALRPFSRKRPALTCCSVMVPRSTYWRLRAIEETRGNSGGGGERDFGTANARNTGVPGFLAHLHLP